ncbi:MAG: VOC family protein [Planctomycetaceae bacterium]
MAVVRVLTWILPPCHPLMAVIRPQNMFAAPPFMNLTVLRSPDIDRASTFYSEMGLLFTKHRHGSGPEHYTSCVDGFVFEIYPLGKNPPTVGTRIGFSVEDVDSIVTMLVAIGAELMSPAAESEWGRRVVVKDLDGHVVELLTPPNRDKIVSSDKTSTGVITVTHSDGMNPGDADRE